MEKHNILMVVRYVGFLLTIISNNSMRRFALGVHWAFWGVAIMEETDLSGFPDHDIVTAWAADMVDVRPVFRGLADGGIAGKEIAMMLGVAPSTVSKWRRGAARPNEDAIQFLTLILADVIGAKERTLDAMDGVPLAWRLGRESELAAMRQSLFRQEAINRVLQPAALRDGARMFRDWLQRSSAPVRAMRPQSVRIVA